MSARSTDPKGSHLAAESVKMRATSQRAIILNAYRDRAPLTDEQAAVRANVSERSCWWKRCSELRELGLIEFCGEFENLVESSSGEKRQQAVITETGSDWLISQENAGHAFDAIGRVPDPVRGFAALADMSTMRSSAIGWKRQWQETHKALQTANAKLAIANQQTIEATDLATAHARTIEKLEGELIALSEARDQQIGDLKGELVSADQQRVRANSLFDEVREAKRQRDALRVEVKKLIGEANQRDSVVKKATGERDALIEEMDGLRQKFVELTERNLVAQARLANDSRDAEQEARNLVEALGRATELGGRIQRADRMLDHWQKNRPRGAFIQVRSVAHLVAELRVTLAGTRVKTEPDK